MNNASESPLSAALSCLRAGDTTIATFEDPEGRVYPTTNTTNVHIFEVRNGQSNVYRDLDDNEFRKHLKDDHVDLSQNRRLRIIMLDGDENDAERLSIAPDTLKLVLEKYKISPRFAFYISRQQMASGSTHLDPTTNEPNRHEFWWSAVVRAQAEHIADSTRRVMNWLRCCIWADFNTSTGNSTILAFRYPIWMREAFFVDFAGARGEILQQHPMMAHATWLENLCTHTRDVNKWFFEPLYLIEQKAIALKTPADLFCNSRELTKVYQQIRQVLTDYEIFLLSAKSIRKHNEKLAPLLQIYSRETNTEKPSLELQNQLDICFRQVRKELKLGKIYLTLYLERCTSGIQDAEALSTKYSAEIQLRTSLEFTQLSKDSTEDNKSLKTIQILTAIFLPPSLISSIFGMGFFNASREGEGGEVVFSVAGNWWWYFAITFPVTAVVLVVFVRERLGVGGRRKGVGEGEGSEEELEKGGR